MAGFRLVDKIFIHAVLGLVTGLLHGHLGQGQGGKPGLQGQQGLGRQMLALGRRHGLAIQRGRQFVRQALASGQAAQLQ